MSLPISTPKAVFAPLVFEKALGIDGVGPEFLRLGNHVLTGAVMISPWGAQSWGGLADTATPLSLAGQIDVLILGGGKDIQPVPPAFRKAMEEAGIGVEPMSTPIAARTYNLLMNEGRRVALVALPASQAKA
jgi:uncharacterized protein